MQTIRWKTIAIDNLGTKFTFPPQAKLTSASLTHLLSLLCRIPELLGESVMFGSSVIGRGVESCLRAGGGRLVTEEVWMAWAGREPPELVWLTTAYRQAAATQVRDSDPTQLYLSPCHTGSTQHAMLSLSAISSGGSSLPVPAVPPVRPLPGLFLCRTRHQGTQAPAPSAGVLLPLHQT